MSEILDLGKIQNEIKEGVSATLNGDEDKLMFKELSKVEGFKDYLTRTMANDLRRHMLASDETINMVKGAYYRTSYLYQQLLKYSE